MKFMLYIVFFLISSCSSQLSVNPDVLKSGIVGSYYEVLIDIDGGRVIEDSLRVNISNGSGLKYKLKDQNLVDASNHIVVYGTPKKNGKISLNITGYVYKEGFLNDNHFNKTYFINVK